MPIYTFTGCVNIVKGDLIIDDIFETEDQLADWMEHDDQKKYDRTEYVQDRIEMGEEASCEELGLLSFKRGVIMETDVTYEVGHIRYNYGCCQVYAIKTEKGKVQEKQVQVQPEKVVTQKVLAGVQTKDIKF
jgi:hypothetical protein